MMPRWTNLNESDQKAFRAISVFLSGRLEEQATIDWALRLKPDNSVGRLALLELIDSREGRQIREPWQSAWRLIEESWNELTVEEHSSVNIYNVQPRLLAGEKSGSLVTAIVRLVAPRLNVKPHSDLHWHYQKPRRRPKTVDSIFSTSLTSGKIVDPEKLEIGNLTDPSFLRSLAQALDTSVAIGLEIARSMGWNEKEVYWKIGQLHRVYYVAIDDRADGEDEPDEFHHGIAPSTKLLHAVVSKLIDIDISTAIQFVDRWKLTNSPVHLRLWAALSQDSRVTPTNDVSVLLLSLDDSSFWNLHYFPEIAELRARRFREFDPEDQKSLLARLRKLPPRNYWPRGGDAERIKNARLYWAVRECRRIEIAGAHLPKRDKKWLDANLLQFRDLEEMDRLDEGFLSSPKVRSVLSNPDNRYDLLAGEQRLKALETALSSTRGSWDDDPARRAAEWIRQPENIIHVLNDFESTTDGGSAFPRVWDRFGWRHTLETKQGADIKQNELLAECLRVLLLLDKLPEATTRQAIAGISDWFSVWEKQIVILPEGLNVWLKFWPIAVEVTNTEQHEEEKVDLSTVLQSSNNHKSVDLDTLNSPTGKFVGVFLAACPSLDEKDHPFDIDGSPRRMRDTIIAATGRSRLIALHRMIEHLPYFLRADSKWASEYLIKPLNAYNFEAIALWQAIARRTHFKEVLEVIGVSMAERAIDRRLSRETRRSLVFSLVIECLHSFREKRAPVVPRARIQQMLRSLDDEVRAYGAEAVQRFVRDISALRTENEVTYSPEQLLRSVAIPFFQAVWPQELSLATPGVSRALADLPATVPEAFDEAVYAIERFLVPFDCWSMLEYGLYGGKDEKPKLMIIDNKAKAAAFLQLLDLTIGKADGSVIPHDLADALDQIRIVAPNLSENQVFRRLATAARR